MFQKPGSAPDVGWAFMFGITAILGSWGSGTLGQSDWTRYAKRRFAPTLSQLIASPLTIAATATIGIIVTSASRDIMGGDIEWNPIYLLADIQDFYGSSPGVRAAVFFASIGMVFSQFSVLYYFLGNYELWLTQRKLDFSCPKLGILRYGHGRPVAPIYQYSQGWIYHGLYRNCSSV